MPPGGASRRGRSRGRRRRRGPRASSSARYCSSASSAPSGSCSSSTDGLRRVAQEAHAELEIGHRHALVGGVDQPCCQSRRPSRAPGRSRRRRCRTPRAASGESVKPATQIGAATAPGSSALDERLHRVPQRPADRRARAALSLDVRRARSRPGRATRATPASASAGVWPGSSRQSTVTSQSAGITLRLSEACAIVGDTVIPSSGSISSPASGATARAAASASPAAGTSPSNAARKPATSGISCGSAANSPSRCDERRGLDERVVGDRRHRRVAAPAAHAQDERRAHLLGGRAEVEHLPAELDPVAGALVEREVCANRVGVRVDEPLQPEAVADLLVGGRDEDQVARASPALARQRRERDGRRCDLALSCRARRAPTPRRRRARRRTAHAATRARRPARRRCARAARGDGPSPRPRIRATRFARSGTRA